MAKVSSSAAPVLGDLTKLTVDELAGKMLGSDVVVFSAGAGGAGMEVTNAIDGKGLELAADAARKVGLKRFLLVSVFPDALLLSARKASRTSCGSKSSRTSISRPQRSIGSSCVRAP